MFQTTPKSGVSTPPKTNGWNLKISTWKRRFSSTKPSTFWVPAVSFRWWFSFCRQATTENHLTGPEKHQPIHQPTGPASWEDMRTRCITSRIGDNLRTPAAWHPQNRRLQMIAKVAKCDQNSIPWYGIVNRLYLYTCKQTIQINHSCR